MCISILESVQRVLKLQALIKEKKEKKENLLLLLKDLRLNF